MSKILPEFVAAIDLGSNSFHMIVCRINDGKLQILDRLKEMVRLASGLDKNQHLDHDTQKRGLACLERFGQRIRNFPPGSVRVVGTNTLRTAVNSQDFISKAEQILGHPIHIIAGIEEARLIYQGVAHSITSQANTRLVMDIGGGSTEYIVGTGDKPIYKESLNMGCVSISNQFFKKGRLTPSAYKDALIFAEQELEPLQKHYHASLWDEAIGASGSLKAIDKVLQSCQWSNNGITQESLEKLVTRILQCKHIKELNLPDLDPERLPVFVGGVVIIDATFRILGIKQMTVADGALREGLIHDLIGRIYHSDIRSETVSMLAERYHSDQQHAKRVGQTVNAMLEQIKFFKSEDKEIIQLTLNWASILHEIGRDIAHNQYHKHSAYVIEHSDLAGFSSQDQLLIATIVKNHRRRFELKNFLKLPMPWSNLAPYMCILLRIAVTLHRSRLDNLLPEFEIKMKENLIKLKFPEFWLDSAPLTVADLKMEADYLKACGFKLKFE